MMEYRAPTVNSSATAIPVHSAAVVRFPKIQEADYRTLTRDISVTDISPVDQRQRVEKGKDGQKMPVDATYYFTLESRIVIGLDIGANLGAGIDFVLELLL